MNSDWEKTKPKVPGRYLTRHAKTDEPVNFVVVTKRTTGLSVYCKAYNDRVPMSQIGTRELEWRRMPKGAASYDSIKDIFNP